MPEHGYKSGAFKILALTKEIYVPFLGYMSKV